MRIEKVENGFYKVYGKTNSKQVEDREIGQIEKNGNHWEIYVTGRGMLAGHKNTWDNLRYRTKKQAVDVLVEFVEQADNCVII